jgi:hypothetical protein
MSTTTSRSTARNPHTGAELQDEPLAAPCTDGDPASLAGIDSRRARDLYYKYRAAVAYVAVETPAGDESIGTAFHVGDNIW